MACRYIVLVVLMGTALSQYSQSYRKSPLPRPSPAHNLITKAIFLELTAKPNYEFNYVVADPYSGDRKTHQESRHGDVVQGRYSLIDADGTTRIVEYFADSLHGFNAIVRKEVL